MEKFVLVAIAGVLAGCAPPKMELATTGGSKADGVVEVSYEILETEKQGYDEEKALREAVKRCQAWGYEGAEPFGGERKTCSVSPGFWTSCYMWRFDISYQCLGEKTSTTPSNSASAQAPVFKTNQK